MRFVDLILSNKLDEAKDILRSRLSEIVSKRLQEAKRYVAEDMLEEVELDEAKRNEEVKKVIKYLLGKEKQGVVLEEIS